MENENIAAILWVITNWKLVGVIGGFAIGIALARNKLNQLSKVVDDLEKRFNKTAEALAELDKKVDIMKNDFGHIQLSTTNQLESISYDVKTLTNQLISGKSL